MFQNLLVIVGWSMLFSAKTRLSLIESQRKKVIVVVVVVVFVVVVVGSLVAEIYLLLLLIPETYLLKFCQNQVMNRWDIAGIEFPVVVGGWWSKVFPCQTQLLCCGWGCDKNLGSKENIGPKKYMSKNHFSPKHSAQR